MEIFSNKLTKTDVGKRLAIQSKSLQSFPGFEVGNHSQLVKVEDEEAKEWFLRLNIRRGMHKKPVLQAGWLEFVKSKKRNIGDEVQFVMEKDEATGVKYKIKGKKPVKLLEAVNGHR